MTTANADDNDSTTPELVTSAVKKYQIDLSPDDQRWTTITIINDGLVVAREMAKTLLLDQIKAGMFYARVRPYVPDTYTYHVDVKIIESGVN